MNLNVYPTKFECYEEQEPVFNVEAFDEVCANVKISTVVTKDSWCDIAEEIQRCLNKMFPDEQSTKS